MYISFAVLLYTYLESDPRAPSGPAQVKAVSQKASLKLLTPSLRRFCLVGFPCHAGQREGVELCVRLGAPGLISASGLGSRGVLLFPF